MNDVSVLCISSPPETKKICRVIQHYQHSLFLQEQNSPFPYFPPLVREADSTFRRVVLFSFLAFFSTLQS